MNILSIETSCDETALTIMRADGDFPNATYEILGNALLSQIDIHKEYGGVFPALAKREHARTIVPLFKKVLEEAFENETQKIKSEPFDEKTKDEIAKILEREPELWKELEKFIDEYGRPDIDLISVTAGPGLEPALWVGVNFAIALATLYNIPIVPANHMEGHVLASLFDGQKLAPVEFPALALLISGGHTELVLMRAFTTYEKIGQTRDDAIGEAFDKVARLMGLSYPGGPAISRLADEARGKGLPAFAALPRPMRDSGDLDFSFSGLKTAVRYAIQDKELTDDEKAALARDFEDAAAEVLLAKTRQAVDQHGIKTLILGGGVSANRYIRDEFANFFAREYPDVTAYLPDPALTTDNSIMIALAGHARAKAALAPHEARTITARGNLSLA